jgi:sugar-specific transcriptional regulator TrmB
MATAEILKNLGLSDKEAEVYLASLTLGEATAGKIAEHAGVKRPTTYVVLDELESKGYITKALVAGVHYYYPEHPKKILAEAELRLADLKTALPQMESMLNKESGRPRVIIYGNKDDLDRAYDESFIATGEVLYMSTIRLSQSVFAKTFRKMDLAQLSENYRMRELVDESEEGIKYALSVQGEQREVRLIPKEFLPFEVDIGIFGRKVLVTSLNPDVFTVSMESAEINQAFRMMFNSLWQLAKVPLAENK